ncbi:hypothetical protein DENIS_4146 [Desulfonema ishimotonii]|uniref:Porin n=1 Tax=Desulfonema ishimotonii TaxID=45657 RepID=A0A401G1U3_9BACT|nr:hypothetical protein [Desulfonema ishimotonii]GBC63153.1 hypothetical protein DENIS_4146 [Desulfonema ishimotonii]
MLKIGQAGLIFMVVATVFAPGADALDLNGTDIHGFISQGWLKSDSNNYLADSEDGSFQFNEMGINFNRELTDRLHVGIQLFARDQGDIGNNDVVVDWAYGDYHWRDCAGIRAGLIRIAHGLYNETRDMDMLRNSILLPQSIYPENWRDAFSRLQGVGIYGEITPENAGSFSYLIQAGGIDVDNDGGVAKYLEGQLLFFDVKEFNIDIIYNGRLEWNTPVEGLRLGVTGFTIPEFDITLKSNVPLAPGMPAGIGATFDIDPFHGWVCAAEYTWENLTLSAEYMNLKIGGSIDNILPEFETTSEGYYLAAAWRFTDWFELGAYYSEYYPDKDDRDGKNFKDQGLDDYRAWLKDFALTARFDINEYWVAKLEGHVMDGAADLLPQDNPDGFDDRWFLFAAKVSFTF